VPRLCRYVGGDFQAGEMIKRLFKFSTVRMKLVGSVLLLTVPALLLMYIYDLPMSGFAGGFLALVAAWMGGEFFVRRQVQAMTRTAQKIADGDLGTRTGLPASEDELGKLAKIFDRMAESLEQRNAERGQTERILLSRALEQTVVAALGQFALTSNDLDALLNQAAILVSQTLDVEFAAVFKRLPDGQLLLQEGAGWNTEEIGRAKVPGDPATQIGHTLHTAEPAVVTDVKMEKRFAPSPFLDAHGVASGATIAILTRGQLFGVLGVHTAHRRDFTADETQFLIAVAGCIGMAADHLNLEQQLRQSQKMESIGQLAAGVAHDFNNMLTIIQGHSSALLAKPSLPPGVVDPVQSVFFAAERAASLTRQLLMFSRRNIMQPRPLDLGETVGNMTKLLGRLLGENVTLKFQCPAGLPAVQGDTGMIEQVVMNLAVNARDAMPGGGTLAIEIELMTVDAAYAEMRPDARPGPFLRLRVTDTGTGMDTATLSRIFEPFFTTKEVGKGTGLGLATVYGIVKQHEGWIEVNSEPGKGTTFDVFFPASDQSVAPAAVEIASTTPVTGGNETILLVEDEAILREMARDILRDCGYRLLEASSGKEALAVWRESSGQVDLLLTDMMMPEGISGVDLAQRLLADRPNLKIIFTSGYTSQEISAELLSRSRAHFLQKPYSHTALARAVRGCLDRSTVKP
jgi:signal transduction histidine kinase/ActR/RegA family two-component response regulator/HAMP domain-containing protein